MDEYKAIARERYERRLKKLQQQDSDAFASNEQPSQSFPAHPSPLSSSPSPSSSTPKSPASLLETEEKNGWNSPNPPPVPVDSRSPPKISPVAISKPPLPSVPPLLPASTPKHLSPKTSAPGSPSAARPSPPPLPSTPPSPVALLAFKPSRPPPAPPAKSRLTIEANRVKLAPGSNPYPEGYSPTNPFPSPTDQTQHINQTKSANLPVNRKSPVASPDLPQTRANRTTSVPDQVLPHEAGTEARRVAPGSAPPPPLRHINGPAVKLQGASHYDLRGHVVQLPPHVKSNHSSARHRPQPQPHIVQMPSSFSSSSQASSSASSSFSDSSSLVAALQFSEDEKLAAKYQRAEERRLAKLREKQTAMSEELIARMSVDPSVFDAEIARQMHEEMKNNVRNTAPTRSTSPPTESLLPYSRVSASSSSSSTPWAEEEARRIQQEEESKASEATVREILAGQLSRATGQQVNPDDLSIPDALAQVEAAVSLQNQKKKGVLAAIKARFLGSRSSRASAAAAAAAAGRSSPNLSGGNRSPHSPISPIERARVDIDNMSYDELLALGEAMGEVKKRGLEPEAIERLPTAIYERKKKDLIEGEEGEGEEKKNEEAVSPSTVAASVPVSDEGQPPLPKKKSTFSSLFGLRKTKKKGEALEPNSPGYAAAGMPSLSINVIPAAVPTDKRDSCSICLEAFEVGEVIKFLPCFHSFHRDCLDAWLAVNASCPIDKLQVKS